MAGSNHRGAGRQTTRRALRAIGLALAAGVWLAPVAARADIVTDWSAEADALGDGGANWHSLAVMHMALHDALNAARPTYARWVPAGPGEPAGAGALPDAAAAAAAASVLTALHPDRQARIAAVYEAQLAAMPPGAPRDAGVALGRAVGATVLASRDHDGFEIVTFFAGSDVDGKWRPVPPNDATSGLTGVRPFLFPRRDDYAGTPPPEPGSPRYLADVAEVRRLGGADSRDRLAEQGEAARFWAYQSTQRGVLHFIADRLENEPLPGGLAEHAWRMSQIAAAMADGAIVTWAEKERYAFWRPITAIRSGRFGVAADPAWQTFIETPPHPEYPSGHATDCFTGMGFLRAVTGREYGPFTYVAQSGLPTEDHQSEAEKKAGAGPAPTVLRPIRRQFPSMEAAAQECADSRIYAGVHFRSANEESRRLAATIVQRALASVPKLPR